MWLVFTLLDKDNCELSKMPVTIKLAAAGRRLLAVCLFALLQVINPCDQSVCDFIVVWLATAARADFTQPSPAPIFFLAIVLFRLFLFFLCIVPKSESHSWKPTHCRSVSDGPSLHRHPEIKADLMRKMWGLVSDFAWVS